MEEKIPVEVRSWLYRLGAAVIPLLVLYGVLDDSSAALWLGVLGAVLGLSTSVLAAVNTPRTPQGHGSEAGGH